MKAFSYLRVSGRGQVLGDGFPRQREAIEKDAKTNGIVIEKEFRDEGISGTTELADRDGLTRLLERIASNGVRTVLVERSDRVARDLLVGEVILGQFRDLGVTMIEAASGNVLTADDGDATKVLIRQILGAVSQFDNSVIVSKLEQFYAGSLHIPSHKYPPPLRPEGAGLDRPGRSRTTTVVPRRPGSASTTELPPSPERASPRAAPMVPPFQGIDRKFGLLTQGGVPRLCRVTVPWAIESGPL